MVEAGEKFLFFKEERINGVLSLAELITKERARKGISARQKRRRRESINLKEWRREIRICTPRGVRANGIEALSLSFWARMYITALILLWHSELCIVVKHSSSFFYPLDIFKRRETRERERLSCSSPSNHFYIKRPLWDEVGFPQIIVSNLPVYFFFIQYPRASC